jgi:uncharacterized protein (TIGR00725 family)
MVETIKPLIAICGSDGDDSNLTQFGLEIAQHIGELIAKRNALVICGGRGGIMEAVSRGTKKGGGKTIGILPSSNADEVNQYIDFAIPTGLGHKRNFIIVTAGQCLIAIGGRWGTLNEISFGFILNKPVVLVKNTGGVVDMLLKSSFLEEYRGRFSIAGNAKEAVDQAFSFINNSMSFDV